MDQRAAVVGGLAAARESFDRFYRAEHGPLFSTLLLLARDRAQAEDVAHEAFVRVLERWDRVERMSAPRAYLYRVALNLHRNVVRRARRTTRKRLFEREHEPDLAEGVVGRADVARALAALSREQREAVVLVDLVGMTSEEAAEALSIAATAVRARVYRARAVLRRELVTDG